MNYRFHQPPKSDDGKWKHVLPTGISRVGRETHDDWQIDITHCRVGTSIARDLYNVIIRHATKGYQESLTGFRTKSAAERAAHRRVELLSAIRHPVKSDPRCRARPLKKSN